MRVVPPRVKRCAGLLLALGAVGSTLWLARPYSIDLVRYVVWRATAGRAFATGGAPSGDARIAWRTIGPLDPGAGGAGARGVDGTDPPVVLLHGGFGTDLDWYAQVPALARRRALVLVDTRGHGGSSLGERPLSYRLFAEDVVAVLDALGIGRADVVGWSDGANTGLMLALEHAPRVRRLVAISANARPEGLVPRVREALARGGVGGSPIARLLHRATSPEAERWEALAEGVAGLWRNHPRLDKVDLARIAAPTLVVAGSEDDVRLGHLDEVVRAMPRARLVVLPGVGHRVPQSAPREVLDLIEGFLGAVVPGAG